MTGLLLGVVVFFVIGVWAFRSADQYGPRVTLRQPRPVDDAFIHQAVRHPELIRLPRPWHEPAAKGIYPRVSGKERVH